MAGPTNTVLLETIERFEEKLDRLDQKIQAKLDNLDVKIHSLERENVKNDTVARDVQDHETRIRQLEKLAPAMKLVIWIAGVLGVSVIGLIWALITGQASLLFK
jgi:hypothetical protein